MPLYRSYTEASAILTIAKKLEIRIVKNSTVDILEPNIYGLYLFDGQHQVIVYDDTRSPEQARFTIAHELGHIFLRHTDERERFAKRLEVQADRFAELLLTLSPVHVPDILEDYLAGYPSPWSV